MILLRAYVGDQPAVHWLEVFPAVIGRSMRSDIRLDDPSVSARHAELVAAGDGIALRDLGSTNGILRFGEKVSEVPLHSNEVVYLGDVRVELVIDERLPKTHEARRLPGPPEESGRLSAWKVVIAMAAGAVGVAAVPVLDQYRVFWPPDHPAELFGAALEMWLGILGLAFVLSLFCKLNAKRFHFHMIFALLVVTFIGARAFGAVAPTLAFNLHNWWIGGFVLHAGYAAIAFFAFYRLQGYAFRRWRRRLKAVVAAAVAILTALLVEATLVRRGGGERDRMTELGLPLSDPAGIGRTPEDLLFDMALSVAESDEGRIKVLEKLEAERDAD